MPQHMMRKMILGFNDEKWCSGKKINLDDCEEYIVEKKYIKRNRKNCRWNNRKIISNTFKCLGIQLLWIGNQTYND